MCMHSKAKAIPLSNQEFMLHVKVSPHAHCETQCGHHGGTAQASFSSTKNKLHQT